METSKKKILKKGVETLTERSLSELEYMGVFLSSQGEINNANKSPEYANARKAIENYKNYLMGRIENE